MAQVAKYQFLTKSMSVHNVISSGIHSIERKFWSQMSIEELYSLHLCLSATPDHVLDLLKELIFMNSSQERGSIYNDVFNYNKLVNHSLFMFKIAIQCTMGSCFSSTTCNLDDSSSVTSCSQCRCQYSNSKYHYLSTPPTSLDEQTASTDFLSLLQYSCDKPKGERSVFSPVC